MHSQNSISMSAVTACPPSLSKVMDLRILIVDDDELARSRIGERLEARAMKVTYAADGAAALALAEGRSFAVILVDWQMPVMDGIEFAAALRALDEPDTYIVILSNRDNSMDYERGYRAGVDDYMTKRITDQDMHARIHSGFAIYKLRRALRETQAALAAATRDQHRDSSASGRIR